MKAKLFSLLTVILLSIGASYAEKVQIGDLYYNLNEANLTAEVTSQNSSSPYWSTPITMADIPASVTYNDATYSVTSIGYSAFSGCSDLTSVTIPSSVTSIESQAFANCSGLTSVTIPSSVTSIGDWVFESCSSLTSISVEAENPVYDSRDNCNAVIETATNTLAYGCKNTVIPSSVTSIGQHSFYGCSGLTSIDIPSSITSIGTQAFGDCNSLTFINIPNNVTSIEDTAFGGCSALTTISIGSSVTSIGTQAFNACSNLTSITIPSSVITIGSLAFSNCNSLISMTVEEGNPVYDSRNNCNAIIKTATNTLVVGCRNTVIPSSVTSIGSNAFYACTSLTFLTIPNSITSIGAGAFVGCSSLTSVEIPNSVTSIEVQAFQRCSNLSSITCKAESAPSLGDYVFDGVDKSIPLYVPSGSIAAYQAANLWSEFTNIRAIPSSGGSTPSFPGDPGTLTYDLTLSAAEVNGGTIEGQDPEGAGGYPAGTEVTITAKDITGYEFVRWSDDVTDKTRTIVLNESMTLTALYSHSMIEIAVAAGKWNFICLPPLGDRQYTEDMFTYDGLTGVKWGTYNGSKRAAGQSGWETPDTFNALQGYIIYSTTAGTLRINAYEDEIRQGDSGNTIYAGMTTYASSHPENESWNFLGNPYSQGYNIAGLAATGIESPITVWNGVGYTTFTPGIDEYTLQPFEAFFIQKAEGGAEGINFSREYLEGGDSGNGNIAGSLSGYFSVGESTKIRFSKGNLQYQASTNTWRFAENQYDMIGSDNSNISASYSGWIDLFGWGTGNNPTLSSTDNNDYSTFVDWGTNAISNGGNKANLWRTLTSDEWAYLLQTRSNASALYGHSTVNGITGMIILPDDWQSLASISFTSGTGDYSQNTYTTEQWSKMESAGAIFLPAAGYRMGISVEYVYSHGYLWSATPFETSRAYNFDFGPEYLYPQNDLDRYLGRSVRLVR